MRGIGNGKIKVTNFKLIQFKKKYFDNYSDAEMWLSNATIPNDGEIRQEPGGKHYIFVKEDE